MTTARKKGYTRSMSASICTGMKSVIAGKGRRFYELEFKDNAGGHRAGEIRRIIIDRIELGRDQRCQIRFDATAGSVSRLHAAIVKEGKDWNLLHLSSTNSTFVNGRKITGSTCLKNGDEIRLSADGPRIGFIAPEGDSGLVSTIGLTQRINLFRKQALVPYRKALILIGLVLLAAIAAVATVFVMQQRRIAEQNQQIAQQQELLTRATEQWHAEKARHDSLLAVLSNSNSAMAQEMALSTFQLNGMQGRVSGIEHHIPRINAANASTEALNRVLPYIYYIHTTEVEVTMPDGTAFTLDTGLDISGWSGTGFLLDDGRLVTARHVIRGWDFWEDVDDDLFELNRIVNNGGKVVIHFLAASASGDVMQLTSDKFAYDPSKDDATEYNGERITLAPIGDTDFVYMHTGRRGGIGYEPSLSTNLERGTSLTILGFPKGEGVADESINPLFGTASVGLPGLQDGVIVTTGSNFDTGNSGGPAMITDGDGNLKVVGIVSAIRGKTLGYIVPISQIN